MPFALHLDSVLGLGREARDLTLIQVCLRGVIVFTAALVMIRCGDRRFLSQKTAFDAVLGYILASMLARAVSGTAAFWPSLGGGFALVLLHRALASLSRRSHALGNLIKGRSDVVILNGRLDERVAYRNRLSVHDIQEDIRLHGNVMNVEDVVLGILERNGQMSVVRK